METILIRPELLQLVIDGKKKSTCRNGIRNYPIGRAILKSNQSDDHCFINITKLVYHKLGDVTDEMAKDDGFDTKDNLLAVMQEIYAGITDESDITIVYFEKELGVY